jgi:protein phosphatase
MDTHDSETGLVRNLNWEVKCFGLTDQGRNRDTNEDQFTIAALVKAMHVMSTSLPQPEFRRSHDQGFLFVVADGMGGHAAGETASALAVDSVETFVLECLKWFSNCKGPENDEVLSDFQKSLHEANSRIHAEAGEHPECCGMGTTLTLAYCLNQTLFIAHAGDSRCYVFRRGSLIRLTRDHTLVDDMVRHGHITSEIARHHRLRHVVTNALGGAYSQPKSKFTNWNWNRETSFCSVPTDSLKCSRTTRSRKFYEPEMHLKQSARNLSRRRMKPVGRITLR